MRITPFLCALAGAGFAGTAANATLDICNQTDRTQFVAIGYQTDEGWASRGWWSIEPGGCAQVVEGDLDRRYYYYRAESDGGSFVDEGYNFCTSQQAFGILGDTECEERGYDTKGFREIDTGPEALHYTWTMTGPEGGFGTDGPPGAAPPPQPAPEPEPEPEAEAPVLPTVPGGIASVEPEPEPDAPSLPTIPGGTPGIVDPEPEPEPEPEPMPEEEPELPSFDEPMGDRNPRDGGSRL